MMLRLGRHLLRLRRHNVLRLLVLATIGSCVDDCWGRSSLLRCRGRRLHEVDDCGRLLQRRLCHLRSELRELILWRGGCLLHWLLHRWLHLLLHGLRIGAELH